MTVAGRPSKASALLRKDRERSVQRQAAGAKGGDCQLTGARASAAARSRGHSAWGKRHIPKAARAGFSAAPTSKSPASKGPGALVHLSNVTKVTTWSCMLCPLSTLMCPSRQKSLYAGHACKMLVFSLSQWVTGRQCSTQNSWCKSGQAVVAAMQLECLRLQALVAVLW